MIYNNNTNDTTHFGSEREHERVLLLLPHTRSHEQFRMEVPADDDGSLVDIPRAALLEWYVGSPSPSLAATGSVLPNDEPYQVTPQPPSNHHHHSRATNTILATRRATTTSITAGNETTDAKLAGLRKTGSLPLLPSFAPLTDDRQTRFTIEKRTSKKKTSRALNSLFELVDEYEVNDADDNTKDADNNINYFCARPETQPGLDFDESRGRQYFNACRQSSVNPGADIANLEGINKNQVIVVNDVVSHKIAEPVSHDRNYPNNLNFHTTTSTSTNSIGNSNTRTRRRESHKIKSDDHDIFNNDNDNDNNYYNTSSTNKKNKNNNNMPSEVADCLPRQRSRAIAINRSRPLDVMDGYRSEPRDSANEKGCVDAELYDYATWRMYNRIIDHRRKNLLRSSCSSSLQQQQREREDGGGGSSSPSPTGGSSAYHRSAASSSHHSNEGLSASPTTKHGTDAHNNTARAMSLMMHHQAPYPTDDYLVEEEDEIFDLEL